MSRSFSVLFTSILIAPSAIADTATFTPLGVLPGDNYSVSLGVSNDGHYVVGGSSNQPGSLDHEAVRWSADGEMTPLGFFQLGYPHSVGYGLSADGSVVVGIVSGSSYVDWRPSRYSQAMGWASLGALPGGTFQGAALGVSNDGAIIVGWTRMADGNTQQAFRWTQRTGMVGLGIGSRANAISGDGTTIVGRWGVHAFRWTEPNGMVDLGTLGGAYSEAYGVSADGSVIIGSATYTFKGLPQEIPFRWQNDFMIGLGTQPGRALGVSADGNLVVGGAGGAFIWDSTNGVRSLRNVLINEYGLGSALSGWALGEATAITPDGNTIVGWGTDPQGQTQAWMVEFNPMAIPGDITGDGVVNVNDLLAAINAWGQCPAPPATCAADVTGDGVVDVSDLLLVINNWG